MQVKRPPIVVIMGSVDHGKTTLLDYIRKTAVAAKEAGGITQSVGAYEVVHARVHPSSSTGVGRKDEGKITFIDTPGHEAFTKIRERGTKIADIAVIVVAADDSVKPQTKAAIKIAVDSQTPFVVAINKVDKNNADANRTKNDLMQAGVLLEGYGGNVSYKEISAKTGQGVDELLDLILLTAEVEDLKYDPVNEPTGFILESKLDSRRGPMATALVLDGTLRTDDIIAAGTASGKIKALHNFLGKPIKEATPSSPVLIFGFKELPKVGDVFRAGKNAVAAVPVASQDQKKPEAKSTAEALKVILLADATGSLEALSGIVKSLPLNGRKLEVIAEEVGEVTDGNVKLAISTGAIIVVFRTKVTKVADNLARVNRVRIIQSEIIYELIKVLGELLVAEAGPSGRLEILAVFGKKGGKQIVGGKVLGGEIKNNSVLEIERKNAIIDRGRVINLQQAKKDVAKVEAGKEFGMLFDTKVEMMAGDILIARQQ